MAAQTFKRLSRAGPEANLKVRSLICFKEKGERESWEPRRRELVAFVSNSLFDHRFVGQHGERHGFHPQEVEGADSIQH